MSKMMILLSVAAIAAGGASFASTSSQQMSNTSGSSPAPSDQPKICKTVVGQERGSKPYEMCMTKAEWEAKKIADAKDPNRIVCHYEEESGTRFRSAKVCMTAAEWWNARQAERQNIERMQSQSCVPGGGC
jgi:hypothetical protein